MSDNVDKKSQGAGDGDIPHMGVLFRTMLERDPSKRKVKPTPTVDLFSFALESESEDSDFKIEEGESDDDSDSDSLSDTDPSCEPSEEEEEPVANSEQIKIVNGSETLPEDISKLTNCNKVIPKNFQLPEGIPQVRVCCICLGVHSSDVNEVVECDSCGILVHEGCYGVTEGGSVSSTASSCSTEPWFCEPCQANIVSPPCQLCPNLGGALKETDTGLWVHLVCALYIPGIAFGEVDKLTQVTLFEMPYNRWGAKSCSLCTDPWLSRTGVCIGCDAGMCRTFFHVTCAQRDGLLSETFHEDAVQADPFYANCKLHTEKSTLKRRKSNYLSHQRHLQWWTSRRSAEQELLSSGGDSELSLRRILRKLGRQRNKFTTKHWPRATWVPTQKMPRLLTTSASAVRRLRHKAVLMDVDVEGEELRESQVAALADVPRKWHLAPAFSVEFIAYVIDRERRIVSMKEQTVSMREECRELEDSEKHWRLRYDCLVEEQNMLKSKETAFQNQLAALHQILSAISPKRDFTIPTQIQPAASRRFSEEVGGHQRHLNRSPPSKAMSRFDQRSSREAQVVESPSTTADHSNQSSQDFWVADIQAAGPSNRPQEVAQGGPNSVGQNALSPRMVFKRVIKSSSPHHLKKRKKTSKLDRTDPSPDAGLGSTLTGRQTLYGQLGYNAHVKPTAICSRLDSTDGNVHSIQESKIGPATPAVSSGTEVPKLKIKIKPVLPKVTQSGFPFIFANSDSEQSQAAQSPYSPLLLDTESCSNSIVETPRNSNRNITCSICAQSGQKSTTVSCDECHKVFHFGCLDPPVKKTPKQRGYSWHCADCDSSERSG